jgi:hypothetical protein
MRKMLLIGLSISLLLGGRTILEIGKTPELVRHYLHHQEHRHIGFIDFLALHYSGTETDSDADEDCRLPFKSITELPQQTATMIVDHPDFIEMPARSIYFAQPLIQFPAIYPPGIFQPPRQV